MISLSECHEVSFCESVVDVAFVMVVVMAVVEVDAEILCRMVQEEEVPSSEGKSEKTVVIR